MVNRIPAKRILRLRAEGLSRRAIAASQHISRNSIAAVYDAADRLDIDFDPDLAQSAVRNCILTRRPVSLCAGNIRGLH